MLPLGQVALLERRDLRPVHVFPGPPVLHRTAACAVVDVLVCGVVVATAVRVVVPALKSVAGLAAPPGVEPASLERLGHAVVSAVPLAITLGPADVPAKVSALLVLPRWRASSGVVPLPHGRTARGAWSGVTGHRAPAIVRRLCRHVAVIALPAGRALLGEARLTLLRLLVAKSASSTWIRTTRAIPVTVCELLSRCRTSSRVSYHAAFWHLGWPPRYAAPFCWRSALPAVAGWGLVFCCGLARGSLPRDFRQNLALQRRH